ncbi:MAG: hypothetical protein R2756_14155 [Bacteroidales bacterium]
MMFLSLLIILTGYSEEKVPGRDIIVRNTMSGIEITVTTDATGMATTALKKVLILSRLQVRQMTTI